MLATARRSDTIILTFHCKVKMLTNLDTRLHAQAISIVSKQCKKQKQYSLFLLFSFSLLFNQIVCKGRTVALQKELVADLVGDYLFTDSAFIDRLYAGNRNAFEKAFDEVKYFCRMATAGSKEAKQMEKVKKAFEDAYRQDAKNTADDGGVRYDISDHAETQFTANEIQAIQSVGRKSINQFNSNDIAVTQKFAEKYWQEMGTKSPFYRAWFGDWRVKDSTLIQIASKQSDTRTDHINKDTGWIIRNSSKVHDETKKHHSIKNREAVPYLAYIDEIIENAVLLDTESLGKKKSENSLLMHYLYAVADIGNGPEVLKLHVEEMYNPGKRNTGQRAYALQNIEKAFVAHGGVQGKTSSPRSSATNATSTVADLFVLVKRMDASFAPNNSSKIVNADGTPKVMYHGTRAENGDFYVFDASKAVKKGGLGLRAMGKGNYFTAKKLDGTERYGSRVITAYLDIKNPFVYNGGGSFYSQVTSELGLDPKIGADALQQEMRKRGYDGVVQYDSNGEISIAVTFDSNQIKSATDNIGTFDGDNPDIRYSVSSQEELAPVRKDLRPDRIYGSDVELAPVRQDVQAQTETEERGEYDDLPFEMPEGIGQ